MKESQNDKLLRIENKIDKIVDRVQEVEVILGKQHVTQREHTKDLAEHMRRTDLLEQQIKPLEKKAAMIEGALKLIGGMAVLVGIVQGLFALLESLRHVK